MNTADQRRGYLTAIADLPLSLRAAVHGLSAEQLDTPYREGGWTVRQVVHHLADSHMHAYIRMRFILTEDHPTLKPYQQDDWAALPDASTASVESSLSLLDGLHQRWTALLSALPESAWSRTALHPERGEVSLDDLLQTYGRHGANHVAQIRGLRERQGW